MDHKAASTQGLNRWRKQKRYITQQNALLRSKPTNPHQLRYLKVTKVHEEFSKNWGKELSKITLEGKQEQKVIP